MFFLLPKEKEMQPIERAFRYSCIFPMILLILACGFAMPLVVVSTQQVFSMFFVLSDHIMEFEIQSSANQASRIVSARSTGHSLLENRLVTFFYAHFAFLHFIGWSGQG